jgi:hypothetical protein
MLWLIHPSIQSGQQRQKCNELMCYLLPQWTLLKRGGWTSLEFHQIKRRCAACRFQKKCINDMQNITYWKPKYVTMFNQISYLFYFIRLFILVCKPWVGDYNAHHKSFHYLVGLVQVGKLCTCIHWFTLVYKLQVDNVKSTKNGSNGWYFL